jgi:hypothetical protein
MISRRSLILALLGGCGLDRVVHAGALQLEGCCLVADGFVGSDDDVDRMVFTSGDRETDHRLGRALLRLAQVFDVHPGCGFFDDGRQPNARAVPKSTVPGTEGTVLFGQSLFRKTMALNDDGMAVLAVFAHEFGHIAQFRTRVHDTLRDGYPTAKLVELHADFLAGFYWASARRSSQTYGYGLPVI